MSKESDFLELLQCEFSAYTEKGESRKPECNQYCQDVLMNAEKSIDVSAVEEQLDEAKDLRKKVLENLDLHKDMLANAASLKLKLHALKSQNSKSNQKVMRKTAILEREKAALKAQRQNIEDKRLVIKSSSELFRKILGLEILVLKGGRMQFLFRNVVSNDPNAFAYVIVSLNAMMYNVMESYPTLDNLKVLEDALNKTNNLAGFIQYTRFLLKEKLLGTE